MRQKENRSGRQMKRMSIGKKIGAALLAALMTAACAPAAAFADTASDTARAESFSIRTYNETRTEDDQNIEVTVRFDRDIQVLEGAEADVSVKIAGSPLDQAPNTEDGESNRTLSVAADPQDGRNLIITVGSKAGSQFVKQTNASIQIQAADSGITHILTADSGKPADLRYIGTIIPSGLALDTVSSTAGGMQDGTVTAEASVTKQVTHRANVRSMVYIRLLKNGEPVLPESSFDHEGSYVIHAHAFIETASGDTMIPELTESDYAKLIVEGFETSVKNLPDIVSRYTMTQDGDKIVLTDRYPEDEETLDVQIYSWPYDGSVVSDAPSGDDADGALFEDVTGWEKEYVYYLVDRGIVQGRTETLFEPLASVTRAEFVKMLAAAAGTAASGDGETPFSDVSHDAWYAPYVAWASENGLVNGFGGQFRPSDNITKQDMAVMLQRYAQTAGIQIPDMEAGITFDDDATISSYAKEAVYGLQKAGIVSGDINGRFYPKSSATRAQAAKMLAVFLQVTG